MEIPAPVGAGCARWRTGCPRSVSLESTKVRRNQPITKDPMKRRLLGPIIFLAFVAGTPTMLRAQYLHPKVTGKETAIRKVVLIPAKVDIVKQSMRGPEGMAAESDL